MTENGWHDVAQNRSQSTWPRIELSRSVDHANALMINLQEPKEAAESLLSYLMSICCAHHHLCRHQALIFHQIVAIIDLLILWKKPKGKK